MAERSKRLSISVRPEVYDRIAHAAELVGLSINAWAAYTLGQASRTHEALEAKLTDQMAEVLRSVISEGVDDGDSTP